MIFVNREIQKVYPTPMLSGCQAKEDAIGLISSTHGSVQRIQNSWRKI